MNKRALKKENERLRGELLEASRKICDLRFVNKRYEDELADSKEKYAELLEKYIAMMEKAAKLNEQAVIDMEETKIFACDNGRSYRFPAKHCLFCDNCTHVLYDYTHGPYMWLCDIGEEDFRTCGKFKEEVE